MRSWLVAGTLLMFALVATGCGQLQPFNNPTAPNVIPVRRLTLAAPKYANFLSVQAASRKAHFQIVRPRDTLYDVDSYGVSLPHTPGDPKRYAAVLDYGHVVTPQASKNGVSVLPLIIQNDFELQEAYGSPGVGLTHATSHLRVEGHVVLAGTARPLSGPPEAAIAWTSGRYSFVLIGFHHLALSSLLRIARSFPGRRRAGS